mgnify:CR=1 FL=1
MLLTLLPTAAFAEEAHEHVYEEAFACICTVECTEENRNADCPACGAEDARPEDCALYTGQVEAPALEEEEMPEEADASVDADGQHVHCFCGGSVLAGNHTSHSDVTYQPWSGTSSITYTNNTAYVYLTENATLSGHLTVDGKTLYLCLNGKTLASNGTAKIQVKNGGRLVLCDCRGGGTFKGATQSVWGGACIYLYTSTLDMFGGKLTGGKVTGKGGGGAIALDDQQCIFNMYGGEISGNNGKNYGGAIFRKFNANMPNTTGGTFNMYGGTIKNNTAKNGGAFFSTTGGTINMTGGTISGNTATMNSNDAGGGAIYMRGNGKINISGSAQITGNSSSLDGGAILMGWGEINIAGSAKINSNTASRWGGAICLRQDSNQSTTLYMRGGEISDNKANSEGGAVHVLDKDCQFFLYDGKITGNTSGDGGAIYLNQEPSWLIMQGGEISGNTATGSGGGVYIYRTGSVCQLYSGKIENNKASGNGGGIYINPSNSGQLRVGNEPLVQNNTVSGKANNVYLPSGKTLTIEIGMSKGASIGVTTANISYPVAFSNNYKKDYSNYFFADDANAHVEYKDDQKLYLVSGAVARPLTVTFDPNGGMLAEADKTKSLMTGEPYGTLPVPSYAGYDFTGWYTEQNGGTEIKENTTVTVFGTQTLYAHWRPIHVHAYTQQVQKPEALKTPADCTNNAVYYLSCACGEVSTNDADTFTAANTALDHDWGAWTSNGNDTHTRVCKRDGSHTETDSCSGGTATCTAKAVCTVCGGEYGALAPNNHTGTIYWVTTETTHEGRYTCCEAVAVPMEPHAFGEWVVIYKATAKVWGIVERTCSVCGHQERKDVAPLDGAAAYVLKFETNGGSRISDVYAPYDTKIDLSKYEPVKDGYRFTGWYLDRMLTEGVTSVRMTKNVTVYAGWRRTELPFIDVRGDDWFYDDVAYVYENGLMNGTSETTFSPYISTTRGMIVTILYRMEGKPAVFEACPFTDVKAGAYYERAIVWAAENGIVKGYGNGCFGPDDQITREQMAAILYRYAKNRGLDVSVGENTNILSYDDVLDISEYAVPAMQWACGAQIIHGADGRLTPGAKATRAQVAAILHRFCENVLKP